MFQAIIQYFKDSRAELRKVVWPSRQETINHTIMVVVISLGVAFFLGAVDYVLNKLLELSVV